MTEASTPPEPELKSLRDRPFELLAQLERRGRAVSAQVSQEEAAGREWVGVALRMAGDLYLVAREETREVLGVPASTTRVPGARSWIKGLANVRGQLLPIIDLRHFLGSGVTPVTRNTRVVVVNHREIPAGLLVDEVLGGSGVSYYFLEARPAASAHAVPVDALYNLALDAGSALAGDAAALTGFEQRQKQLEEAAARDPAAPFTSDVRFTRLMSNAAAIVRARGALAGAGGAARETATLVPRLLGESSALAGGLPAGTATAVSGTLERFAARAQRLQLDVTALTQGTGDAGQAAQRIAEGSDYLGQVITGLMGGNSALALPRVTAPESARHLKALDAIYTDLSAAVRRAVAAAPALPAARAASRAIEMDARELAGTASPATIGGVLAWAPLMLLAAGLGILLAGLGAAPRMRRTVERQRPQIGR